MGIIRKFFNQTRKPEGILGIIMLKGMNSGHAKLAETKNQIIMRGSG